MRRVLLAVAHNAIKEVLSSRILYSLLFFAILLIGFSVAIGELSFAEQERIMANTGFTSIHIVMVIISIFLGNALMTHEFERQTYMTVLTKSVSRGRFLIGKFLGLFTVLVFVVAGLMIVLGFVLVASELLKFSIWAIVFLGIVLEAMVLISLSLFFSVFLESLVAIPCVMGVFLIGHWLNEMDFFAKKSTSIMFRYFSDTIQYVIPNLERFNWRSFIYLETPPEAREIFGSVLHGVSWTLVIMALAVFIFQRRDLT